MTRDEFQDALFAKLIEVRQWALLERRDLRFHGSVGIVELPEKEMQQAMPDKAAAIEAGYTGNLCTVCGHSTRPSGGCEICDNCGATSSCG